MIPTINISAWLSPTSTSQSRNSVVDEIRSACRVYGFFQLEGHGIPLEMQNEVLECAERFFSLPLEQKREVSIKKSVGSANRGYEDFQGQRLETKALPDLKEGFFIGEEIPVDSPRAGKFLQGPNQWPVTLPREKFRDPLLEYRRRMVELAELVLRLLGLALPEEHSSANFFDEFMIQPSGNLRLLHYPPQTSTDEMQLGAGAHTDFGGLTLLLQKPATSGLQVWYPPTAAWIPVPVRENAFVVNIGDLLQLWTGGYYRSALHRVINRGENHRYSAPFFYNGNGDLEFEPIGKESGRKTTVSEHIRGKLLTSLGKSDKDSLAVV